MEPGHFGVADDELGHIAAGAGHEVNDARRQAAPLEQFHVVVIGEHGGAGGLPQRDIPDDSGGGGEVTADGGKVEGGNCADKPIQRSVILAVPDSVSAGGLFFKDLLSAPDAEPQEVGELRPSIVEAFSTLR